TASSKKNAPNPETVGWAFESSKGGRAFSYTGGHMQSNWGKDGLRQLVVNGILWSAGLEIPEKGAPNKLDPSDLNKNLENKVAPKKK
ncbi:MAG: thioesterase, partial [Planctomycetes bacterium]|nr:thioesterase [Planctomycetota bacterium]